MPKENDFEGQQDQGGKHGGQAGMPKPASGGPTDQGIVREDRGQANRAQQAAKTKTPSTK